MSTRRALILAAGRGERMRPLSDATPKPLLEAGGKPLVAWHIERLARLGVRDIVINIAHLADRFPAVLGDGSRWGVTLHWSLEAEGSLETGGGMLQARSLLGEAPFLLVNGDVWSDFDLGLLPEQPPGLAHLVLVDVPAEKQRGDFVLEPDGRVRADGSPLLTYAGIGVYRAALLDQWRSAVGDLPGAAADPPRFPLAPLLRQAMARGQVTGQHHRGAWTDVGTPARLAALDRALRTA